MSSVSPPGSPPIFNESPLPLAPPEVIPDYSQFVVDDGGTPMDNVFIEKQLRLLPAILYISWSGPGEGRTFQAYNDVGLFYAVKEPPLSPDFMLSLDVEPGDTTLPEYRSYFVWHRGKVPDLILETVSDRRGGELTFKRNRYARIGVTYYVVFDPARRLNDQVLQSFVLSGGKYAPMERHWYPEVGLGLTLQEGVFEDMKGNWLRWCDAQGKVLLTPNERVAYEQQRREALEARLRELGLEP